MDLWQDGVLLEGGESLVVKIGNQEYCLINVIAEGYDPDLKQHMGVFEGQRIQPDNIDRGKDGGDQPPNDVIVKICLQYVFAISKVILTATGWILTGSYQESKPLRLRKLHITEQQTHPFTRARPLARKGSIQIYQPGRAY